jgi:hypothetical protein
MLKTLRGRITASALTTAPAGAIANGLLLADATAARCDAPKLCRLSPRTRTALPRTASHSSDLNKAPPPPLFPTESITLIGDYNQNKG